jgi:hypothetical protein
MARPTPARAVLLLVAALLVWRTGWLQALLLLPVTLLRSAWAILFNQASEDAGSIRAALFNITTDSKKASWQCQIALLHACQAARIQVN